MKPQKLEKLEKLEKIAQLMGLKYDVKDNHKQFLDKGVRVFNGTLKTNSNNEINITDEDSEFGSSVKEEKLYTFEQVKEIAFESYKEAKLENQGKGFEKWFNNNYKQ